MLHGDEFEYKTVDVTVDQALRTRQDVAALWSVERGSPHDVIRCACEALVAGVDGQYLRELAGVFEREAHLEVPELLPKAMRELGLAFFVRGSAEGRLAAAGVMARRCLDRAMTPRELVAWAHQTFRHGQDQELEPLLILDDDYEITEYTGKTAPAIDEAVFEVCRRIARV